MVGIVGSIYGDGLIDRCYNKGTVNGDTSVGGISGALFNGSKIQLQNCYNTGNVNGGLAIGGIVGLNQGEFTNCYNTGDVNASRQLAGGVVGNNQGICSNCYNIGNISGTARIGGIAGTLSANKAVLSNCYSLEGKSSDIVGDIVNGTVESSSIKTEQEMKSLAPTLGAAFTEDTENINNGYPILSWQQEIRMDN